MYSLDLKERIPCSYFRGERMRSIAGTFDVSLGLVHHIVTYLRGRACDSQTRMPHPAVVVARQPLQTEILSAPS